VISTGNFYLTNMWPILIVTITKRVSLAGFILETDHIRLDELGQAKGSSSSSSSVYKRGQTDGSSVKTNYLHSSSTDFAKKSNMADASSSST
jgi:hypothetical protein